MKVHGSINLFRKADGALVENDVWMGAYPDDYLPMLAPPGDVKTNDVLAYSRSLFGEADQAIDKAAAFFVVGYGFRDIHIHKKILERVRNDKCPLIVLTRDNSTELSELPQKGKNVWVITGTKNAANGETDPSATLFANADQNLSGEFSGVALWQSDVFTEQIFGG